MVADHDNHEHETQQIWLYLSGELTDAEAELLEARVAQDAAVRDQYLQACQQWLTLNTLRQVPKHNSCQQTLQEPVAAELSLKSHALPADSSLPARQHVSRRVSLMRNGAFVCGLFGLGVLTGRWTMEATPPDVQLGQQAATSGVGAGKSDHVVSRPGDSAAHIGSAEDSTETAQPRDSRHIVHLGQGRQLKLREDQELSLAAAWADLQEDLPADAAFASILDEFDPASKDERSFARYGFQSVEESMPEETSTPQIPDWLMLAVILKHRPTTDADAPDAVSPFSSDGEDAL